MVIATRLAVPVVPMIVTAGAVLAVAANCMVPLDLERAMLIWLAAIVFVPVLRLRTLVDEALAPLL